MTSKAQQKEEERQRAIAEAGNDTEPNEGSADEAEPERRTKSEIMYVRLGKIGGQLRKFAAGLDEDEDTEMLDQATQAVALIRSMRKGLIQTEGPLTTADGVTTSEAETPEAETQEHTGAPVGAG